MDILGFDDDDDDEYLGGFKGGIKDITGMGLTYPNPFTLKIEQKMPQLFKNIDKDPNFVSSSRMCPMSLSNRRQPVVLSKEEKDNLLKDQPVVVDGEADFIEYGENPDKPGEKNYFTCPRFWCLLTDKMVTEKEILEGKCGPKVNKVEDAIIPKNAPTVPKGKYVYQFYDKNKKQFPGFMDNKLNPGTCIPCCQAYWNTKEMKKRRQVCQYSNSNSNSTAILKEDTDKDKDDDKKDKKDKKVKIKKLKEKDEEEKDENEKDEKDKQRYIKNDEIDGYIKGPEKFGAQLGEHRWGYLPIILQYFFRQFGEDCQISKTNTNVKSNYTCLLRLGVEVSTTQSFIACIANAIFYKEYTKLDAIKKDYPKLGKILSKVKSGEVPNIKQMKEIIIQICITPEKFPIYQNGNLKTMFSTIENFCKYLRDDTIEIDYTYLWDMITIKNQYFFNKEINLCIFRIPDTDITNNVELICPTNSYKTQFFNPNNPTLMLIVRNNFFEPIYGYKIIDNKLSSTNKFMITKLFLIDSSKTTKTILGEESVLLSNLYKSVISAIMNNKCGYKNVNKFKHAILLDDLIVKIMGNDEDNDNDNEDENNEILHQITNGNKKVIGLHVRLGDKTGFIPCYPSNIRTIIKDVKPLYPCKEVNDDLWQDYEDTLEFLLEFLKLLNDKSKIFQVKDEETSYIIGFLTDTNQFIAIKPPIPSTSAVTSKSIKVVSGVNTFGIDKKIVREDGHGDNNYGDTNHGDNERIQYINRIRQEEYYYNEFRNYVRQLFNNYEYSKERKEIQEISNKTYIMYIEKLNKLIPKLKALVEKSQHLIFNNNNNITKGNKSLVIPKQNLVTGVDNEVVYYYKLADELIRYDRIKSFMFKPYSYLSFSNVKYNTHENEVILLQEMVAQEYFDALIPSTMNIYTEYNTYDTTQPNINLKGMIKEEVNYTDFDNNEIEDTNDNVEIKGIPILTGTIKECFDDHTYYEKSFNTGFDLLTFMLLNIKNVSVTPNNYKNDLIKELNYYSIDKNTNKGIVSIFKRFEGIIPIEISKNRIHFEPLIHNEKYILSQFELWILVEKYKIPSIFISLKNDNVDYFVAFKPDKNLNNLLKVAENESINDNRYMFIILPPTPEDKFKIILNEHINPFIHVDAYTCEKIDEGVDSISIEEYLMNIYHLIKNKK